MVLCLTGWCRWCAAGDHLEVCSGPRTCCTESMELQLSQFARGQLDQAVRRTVGKVADDLDSQGSNFDGEWTRPATETAGRPLRFAGCSHAGLCVCVCACVRACVGVCVWRRCVSLYHFVIAVHFPYGYHLFSSAVLVRSTYQFPATVD